MKLNLTASGKPHELILAYLQENASDVLAEKINSGTPFEKDGKQLVNKKTLDGFMKFASDEARKLAEKGANSACVEDSVVYGWAIHYFEEDSIQGKLYNRDGTEYTPPAKCRKVETKPVAQASPKLQQISFLDLFEQNEKKDMTEQAYDRELTEQSDGSSRNDGQQASEPQQSKPRGLPEFFSLYTAVKERYPDDIALIRLGDFYEAFDEDATVLADELELTLTSRKLTDDVRVPLVGFPYHASDTYIDKIRTRHSVAVIEDSGNITVLTQTVKADSGRITDTDTGGILRSEPTENSAVTFLYKLLDGKLDIA